MRLLSWCWLVCFLLTAAALAEDPAGVEAKVQLDLDNALSRLVPRDQFLLQVTTNSDVVTEKKIVEGETMVQAPETKSVVVPPLPGFQPDIVAQVTPPQQSRTTYKMVDTPTLRAVQTQLTLDDRLGEDVARQAENLVRSYLHANYGAKAKLAVTHARLLAPSLGNYAWPSITPWLAAALVFTLILLWAARAGVLRRAPMPAPPLGYRSVYDALPSGNGTEAATNEALDTPRNPPRALALPAGASTRGSYPSLPTSPEFIDQRTKLLDLFLKNSETFRLYFQRLGENAQSELYAGLRGPAFDSFLEGLGLQIPPRAEDSVSPTEEQMAFYEKNFGEFIQANQWQHDRFFGFLQALGEEQCLALVKQESPLVAGILIKFMKPAQSAYVLPRLNSTQRVEILTQSNLMQRISTDELRAIEEAVRMRVTQLPKFLVGSQQEDIAFWSQVLSQADNQDEILFDLERTRPEIYPALAKFRFQLEDAPTLPKPLLAQVLDESDNQELALALLTCPPPLVDFLLGEITGKRRELLMNTLTMNQGTPPEKTKVARQSITKRFREVMA